MGAKVKNPRKKFLWSIKFVKHPLNPYLFQSCQLPEITVEQVTHGDINRDVKTAGRVSVGNLTIDKLMTTDGSDTWLWDWLMACQDTLLGGGLTPSEYFETAIISELAEDGKSVLNSWYVDEIWPTRVNGIDLDRTASENTIESIEFSVGTIDKV